MDSNFTFPRPQAAVPRPAPSSSSSQKPADPSQPNSRQSNALRASVLDAALELGIGSNSLVADWMFNNALPEEDEEEDQTSSPGLTNGSSATSDESSFSAFTTSSSSFSLSSPSKQHGAGAPFLPNAHSGLTKDSLTRVSESETDRADPGPKIGANTISFPELPIPARPITPSGTRKLKKKPRGDGYESDGGYISEAGKKKDKKKAESNDGHAFPSVETEKEAKKRAKEEKKELQEEERKRKKSLLSAVKASKKSGSKEDDNSKGYDTDGGGISDGKGLGKSKSKKSKSKTAPGDAGGYETDGAGYQSATSTPKKSKTRFFKLSTKGSRPSDLPMQAVPALPVAAPKEIVPLPIAERFATTLSPTIFSPTSPSQDSRAPSPLVSLPPSKTENPSATIPPMTFQPFAPPPSDPEPAPPLSRVGTRSPMPPTDRISHSSNDSTSSSGSNPKRHGGHFSPSREGSNSGHGNSGSYSTVTSHSHQDHAQSSPPTSFSSLPSSQPGPSSSTGSLKLPSISYPITRSISPISPSGSTRPVAPLLITKGLRVGPSLENMSLSSRGPSPAPISPASPYAMGPPRSTAPSPALVAPPSSYSRSPSPFASRPTNPPSAFVSPPNSAAEPTPQRPTHLSIVPSYDYIVPSPSAAQHPGITSPSVFAYYDIPPPSPAPMGPLPSVPVAPVTPATQSESRSSSTSSNSSNPGQFPSAAVLRQRVIDRTPRQLPPDHVAMLQNIQRGKESPFPARPVMPLGSTSNSGPISGLEPKASVRRYRDLYPQAAGSGAVRLQEGMEKPKETRRARFADEPSWIDDVDDDANEEAYEYEGADQELRGVLDRFEDRSSERAEDHAGSALERSHSFQAFSQRRQTVGLAKFNGGGASRDSEHAVDDDRVTVADRNSRWTESVYSRNSILDEDASGQRRERLVRQVEEMLQQDGKMNAPPVPKLPDAYAMGVHSQAASIHVEATPGRSWNRF